VSDAPLRILVVDDDELDRMAVRRLGEGLGLRVEEASSLSEAMTRLRDQPVDGGIDCVLLDFSLPDGDGFSALATFGAAKVRIPVVMLTGLDDADIVARLLNAGAADYLPKRALSRDRLEQVVRQVSRANLAERERNLAESRLLSQKRLLAAVIEQLPSGLIITDQAGRILLRNAKSLEVLGADLGQTRTLTDLIALAESLPDVPRGRLALAKALGTKDEESGDFKVAGPRGDVVVRLRRLDVLGDDGGPVAGLALFADVTELRATEAYQRQVMAIASHDLRNPLSAIAMNAAILSRNDPLPDDRRIKTAARITSSASRMGRMIEDLFDYTAAALGKGIPVRYRQVDLAVVTEEAVSEARAAHAGREITLRKEGDLRGVWDPDRLHQVLQNLLSNAVKYSTPATPIHVACVEDAAASAIDITVENHGEPIAPEFVPHIFDAYRRGPGAGRHSLGLGLYIVRRIVEAHHGIIMVNSTPAEGTTFTIRLPKQISQNDKVLLTPPSGHSRLKT
jgi:sigma-B regulation protein RsbU (phosphoserine phosphatase)